MPLCLKHFAPIALTLVLLTAVWALVPLPVVKVGAAEFHARSKAAIEGLATTVIPPAPFRGVWVATRKEMDARSLSLLQPNCELTLHYANKQNDQQAYLSVVQVGDARTMAGHAPVNCYPGTGWTIDKTEYRQFKIKDVELKPAVYFMHRNSGGSTSRWVVYDLFIFPDGRDGTTLEEIDRVAQDYRKMKYGIAHVQLVTWDPLMTNKERDEIFSILVGSESCLQMVRVLRTGIPHEQ